MSEELAGILDLATAWRRVKRDITERVFIRHPYAVSLVEVDLNSWLASRLEEIRLDRYTPDSMFVCDVPKGGGLIRPGSHLSFKDRLVYAACVGACLASIHRVLAWSQGLVDFSYRLAVHPGNPNWLRNRFTGWRDFQTKSLEMANQRFSHVVVADISSFYESIDICTLMSDLRASGAPAPATDQISTCLNRWAQVQGRGIPQGQTPSDILAKLYLNNIDQTLQSMGFRHLRYVDDIRIFCQTYTDAKRVMIELSKLLRKRGLYVQAAKSEILPTAAAREKFDEVEVLLRPILNSFIRDVIEESGQGNPYLSIHEADELLDSSSDDRSPLEVIKAAFRTYVVEYSGGFKSTIFRFLLNRLGRQRDSSVAAHCLSLLEPHPEETSSILNYLGSVGPGEEIEQRVIGLMSSGQIFYDYQMYEMVEWFYERQSAPSDALLELVRAFAFNLTSPRYLKTICRALLGKFGSSADLERIASLYDETRDPSERVEIICSIRRMERLRRNALLARWAVEGEMNRRAVQWVRREE